ncbi:MAG: hypothetical protein RL616_1542 [Verrucomicrobiota bacterium]
MTPTILYRARTRFDATLSGVPRPKYPLPPDCPQQRAGYAFDCDFEQWMASYPPAPLNAPSNVAAFGLGDANAILTALSQPQDIKSGTGRYTAEFRIVPASWDEFLDQVVTFPGIRDNAYTGGARDPKPLTVHTRLHREYFLADPDNVAAGVLDSAGNAITTVASKGAIPSLYRTPWKFLVSGVITPGSEVTGLVKAGGIPGWLETVPNTETYLEWVDVATAFNAALAGGGTQAWDDTHPPVWDGLIAPPDTIGQYRFTDSRIENYAGNIFCRVSEYVLAQ